MIADVVSYFKLPPILKVPTLIGWDFFCLFPSETRNDVARVASAAARLSARFPQIPLSVINRDASARDTTSSIFNDLQAAGSISKLVGRWGIGKKSPRSSCDVLGRPTGRWKSEVQRSRSGVRPHARPLRRIDLGFTLRSSSHIRKIALKE